jgi:aspartate 1-decarboxylase
MKQVFLEEEIGGELVCNYDIRETGRLSTLVYSPCSNWNSDLMGGTAANLVDDGDELIVNLGDIDTFTLNYMQAQQLLILLLNSSEEKIEIREYEVLKSAGR